MTIALPIWSVDLYPTNKNLTPSNSPLSKGRILLEKTIALPIRSVDLSLFARLIAINEN